MSDPLSDLSEPVRLSPDSMFGNEAEEEDVMLDATTGHEGPEGSEEDLALFLAQQDRTEEMLYGQQVIKIGKAAHILPEALVQWPIERQDVHTATETDLMRFVEWSQTMVKAQEWESDLVNCSDDQSVLTAFESIDETVCVPTNETSVTINSTPLHSELFEVSSLQEDQL